jgi:TolA-binding protein
MKRLIIFCLLIAGFAALPSASAGEKEEIMRLQKDVQTLRDQIQEIDKSFNEKMDGIKSLVVQLNDQMAKSKLVLEKISTHLESLSANLDNQNANARSADDTLLKAVQKLSTKVDESATSIEAVARNVRDLTVQIKTAAPEPPHGGSQSPEVMYSQAYRDFVQGNLDLAIQELNAYINTYPGGNKAASALLNLGDAYFLQNKLPQAKIAFTRVINDSDNPINLASALYKRAQVELTMQESQNAVADLKSIIEKYPTAQDAEKAKAKLQELEPPAPKQPEPKRPKTR